MEIVPIEKLIEPDPVVRGFAGPNGAITTDDIQRLLAPSELRTNLPDPVRSHFDLSHAVCVYGYFQYKFFTLAAQLALLGLEAALRFRFAALNGAGVSAPRKRSLKSLLMWAKKEQLLNFERTEDADDWIRAIVELRNRFAHPEKPSVLTPGMSINTLVNVAQQVDALFETA